MGPSDADDATCRMSMLRCYDSRLAYWMQGVFRWGCEGVDVQMGMVHLTMVAVSELGGELRAS